MASGAEINYSTYSILLKNLLAVGKWRKYIEVSSDFSSTLVTICIFSFLFFFFSFLLFSSLLSLCHANLRTYMQVLEWMENAGIQPSLGMYRNIYSYAWKDGGKEYAALIQEKMGMLSILQVQTSTY